MIKSFQHKGLEDFFYTGKKKGIKPEHADRLERILDRLNAANVIKDMNYPGSNLHKLTGDKKGQYAVKMSGNWRVFFEFSGGNASMLSTMTTIIERHNHEKNEKATYTSWWNY